MITRPIPTCPKCGSIDNRFKSNGLRECLNCPYVGTIAKFRRGGPQSMFDHDRFKPVKIYGRYLPTIADDD